MRTLLLFILISFSAVNAYASNIEADLLTIQQSWAKANYQLSDDAQVDEFERLLTLAESLTSQYPKQAEFWVWKGIVQSSFAGVKGGLGALSLAKKARKSLEHALELDDTALQGSAYTSLGTLFHKVPGWPLGFGDDDEAKELLEKALAINPTGIDPNYFYGEYLFDNKDYTAAQTHLNIALAAPPRSDRALADTARRAEIETLLTKVNKKIARKS